MQPDFIIIGAQKCGTTSLFEFLNASPNIYMPEHKETQFFNRSELYEQGIGSYEKFFSDAKSNQLLGEASPQYLSSQSAARRISEHCSDTRLIAILRDPVERAISHYHMTNRRGRTDLSLTDALLARLESPVGDSLEPNMDNDFLLIGEFGRQLSWYERFAENNQLHTIFLDEMRSEPGLQLTKLSEFLELDDGSIPRNFPHTHRGGTNRFKRLDRFLRNNKGIRSVARFLLSPEKRKAMSFMYDTKLSVRVSHELESIDANLESRLRHYFKNDKEKLESLIGRKVPWA